MKKLLLLWTTIFSQIIVAQNVGVGTTTPHASAQLDITSTNKGLLPPRMTTAERDAIPTPSPGLIIFNTTIQTLEINTLTGWQGLQIQPQSRKLLGGQMTELGYSIQATTDGGFILAAQTYSSVSGDVTGLLHSTFSPDWWIVKLDANRKIVWNKSLGGSSLEDVSSICQTTDGGYIVAGHSRSSDNGDVTNTNHGSDDYWVVKLNDQGIILWNKLLGGTGSDKATAIRQIADGGYIVAGYSTSSASGNVTEVNHGGKDYWILKLDAAGDIIWNRLLGGNGEDEAYDLLQTADGSFVIAGNSTSSQNGDITQLNHGGFSPVDYWIIKIDLGGQLLWGKLIGGDGEDFVKSIVQPNPDEYILAGYSSSSANGDVTATNHGNAGSSDYWIVKLNRFGDVTWNKLLGGAGFDYAWNIKSTTDGGYIIAGSSNSSAHGDVSLVNHGHFDLWIVKLDGAGNITWEKLLGGNVEDKAFSVVQTQDGSFVIAGNSKSSYNGDITAGNHGSEDIWVIKLGSNGVLY